MKFPPDVEFHEDIRLLVWRPRGLLNETVVSNVVSFLEDLESAIQEPFNRLSDTLAADEVELNFQYIIQVSLHRRLSYAGRPPVKSAILATNSTLVHYGKVHALLTQGSPITVRVFQDRAAAEGWLEVPVERLSAKDEQIALTQPNRKINRTMNNRCLFVATFV